VADKVNGWVVAPLCVFCSKPWSSSMMNVEAYASYGCETCGYGREITGTVEIHCDHCARLVYKKEFVSNGY